MCVVDPYKFVQKFIKSSNIMSAHLVETPSRQKWKSNYASSKTHVMKDAAELSKIIEYSQSDSGFHSSKKSYSGLDRKSKNSGNALKLSSRKQHSIRSKFEYQSKGRHSRNEQIAPNKVNRYDYTKKMKSFYNSIQNSKYDVGPPERHERSKDSHKKYKDRSTSKNEGKTKTTLKNKFDFPNSEKTPYFTDPIREEERLIEKQKLKTFLVQQSKSRSITPPHSCCKQSNSSKYEGSSNRPNRKTYECYSPKESECDHTTIFNRPRYLHKSCTCRRFNHFLSNEIETKDIGYRDSDINAEAKIIPIPVPVGHYHYAYPHWPVIQNHWMSMQPIIVPQLHTQRFPSLHSTITTMVPSPMMSHIPYRFPISERPQHRYRTYK